MEKLFRPGKWLVIFCAVFVAVFAVRQFVVDYNLKAQARQWGAYIFNWQWQGSNWASAARVVETDVIHHNDNDAVVRVKAQQKLRQGNNTQLADASATLKLYKRSTGSGVIWELGEVEFH